MTDDWFAAFPIATAGSCLWRPCRPIAKDGGLGWADNAMQKAVGSPLPLVENGDLPGAGTGHLPGWPDDTGR